MIKKRVQLVVQSLVFSDQRLLHDIEQQPESREQHGKNHDRGR